MVEVASGGEPSLPKEEEEENLSDTERYEIDDFTFISSEAAQDVGDGPAEKVDSPDTLPSPPRKKDGKKKRSKHKKKPSSEPGDMVPQDQEETSMNEASVEVPEKQKKSERKRLKRTRSSEDSEEEYDEEELETPRKRKDKSTHDEDDSDDKSDRRKRRSERKKDDFDALASIRKAKEKKDKKEKDREDKTATKDKDIHRSFKDKNREKERDKDGTPPPTSPTEEDSDSEPEDTEVIPVSTFLSEFRPSLPLLQEDNATPKRRSKFGESILSRRPTSPTIVPFERPRIKTSLPPSQPPPLPRLSHFSSEPNGNSHQNSSHSSQSLPHSSHTPLQPPPGSHVPMQPPWEAQDHTDLHDPHGPHGPHGFHQQWDMMMMEQQHQQQHQLLLQQQQQQLLLQQQQQLQQQQHLHLPTGNGEKPKDSSHHKSHSQKHSKEKDKEKRDKEKRDKEKREKAKREKAKREKKHKKEKPKKLDPANPEYATKRKEFKLKLSETVGVRLKKYLKANRIASKDDFKHLARKFTHKIMDLEDAKAVFVIKGNTEEKIHKVIDAYFERHNTYSRSVEAPTTTSTNSSFPQPDNPGAL